MEWASATALKFSISAAKADAQPLRDNEECPVMVD